jgi:hypothetical protein
MKIVKNIFLKEDFDVIKKTQGEKILNQINEKNFCFFYLENIFVKLFNR